MTQKELRAKLLKTAFVSSFVGRARKGDLHAKDPERRAAAWAQWAVEGLSEFKGLSDREYVALALPGAFYDPRGNGPAVRPHLEIASKLLLVPDPLFPDRLSQAGNALCFPWWLVPEVTAVRRAVLASQDSSAQVLVDALNQHRQSLASTLEDLSAKAEPLWGTVENLLVTNLEAVGPLAVGDFDTSDVAELFPAARALELRVVYDERLRDSQGLWSARRVGVWRVTGASGGRRFALGVVTPRLTANSLFHDPLFAPNAEAPGAALVRCLLLRRFLRDGLRHDVDPVVTVDPSVTGGPFLRAVVARPGARLPHASVEAAVNFLQSYPDAELAWETLQRWAGEKYLLTVTRDAFLAAHASATKLVRRADDPERTDIDVLLPICWDDKSRVVRVTFTRADEPGNQKRGS